VTCLTEHDALAQLQRVKTSYQSFIKVNFEHQADDCRTCPTAGSCCTDAHFVNVHITRLEAMAVRQTLELSPRLSATARKAVYQRAHETVEKYGLRTTGDTFSQTYSCPLFEPGTGCLVHRRAKPAPCIQHGCYENWEDLPPGTLQSRVEHRVEQLNIEVYGNSWAWLPTPVWLTLVDPDSDGRELENLIKIWNMRRPMTPSNARQNSRRLPVLASFSSGRQRASLRR
jgi:hypothetical protein